MAVVAGYCIIMYDKKAFSMLSGDRIGKPIAA